MITWETKTVETMVMPNNLDTLSFPESLLLLHLLICIDLMICVCLLEIIHAHDQAIIPYA